MAQLLYEESPVETHTTTRPVRSEASLPCQTLNALRGLCLPGAGGGLRPLDPPTATPGVTHG